MRLVARMPDIRQASALIDSLKKAGLDRDDLIVSDAGKPREYNTVEEALNEISFLKTEREGLNEIETFAEGVRGLQGREGILVAVEALKHEAGMIREMMEQCGAVEIVGD